jgi:hypothetical protein
VLPKRWIVGRTITWLNRCRRLAKDWENLNRKALAFLHLPSIRLMLKIHAVSPGYRMKIKSSEGPKLLRSVMGSRRISFLSSITTRNLISPHFKWSRCRT